MHPIQWYKSLFMWQLRVYSHIPGFKKWARYAIKKYEKNFWKTFAIQMGFSLLMAVAQLTILNGLLKKVNEKREATQADLLEDLEHITDDIKLYKDLSHL